ncbi:MAG: pectinacetylesterase family protein [Lachnospiraceae bacterium]|nr:pectinacetylesterase family protein [Lachnospiraceae bacterium]
MATTENLAVIAGDFAENSISKRIVARHEAPKLTGNPKQGVWYRIPLPGGLSGDGSSYHTYIKSAKSDNLCIFFSGGGVAWDENMAAAPVTGGRVAAGQPNYYWNNLRTFTQIMNINIGITETGKKRNPFNTWNFIVITYSTGDFHLGKSSVAFTNSEGQKELLYFHGYQNFIEAMKQAITFFPHPKKLLIAGDSAGAFAAPALTGDIIDHFYPDCRNITVFSDSSLLEKDDWLHTLRDVWKAEEHIYAPIHSSNPTCDWFENLVSRYGKDLKYLYASSVRDYLLSTFLNDIETGEFTTDESAQEEFFKQNKRMYERLCQLPAPINFFYNDFTHPILTKGRGTVHTSVRQPFFYYKSASGITMSKWLSDAINGKPYDIGSELLHNR